MTLSHSSQQAWSRALRPVASLLCFSALAVGCGGKEEPPKSPTYHVDRDRDEPDDGMQMMAEFGGMNEEKVNSTLHNLQPQLSDCLMKGYDRVEFLSGEVAFLVKVNLSGQAEDALIERSNLGDYRTEQCMLSRLRASRWPKPVGGKIGLARTSIAFDLPSDVRAPVSWQESQLAPALSKSEAELAACGTTGGSYTVTGYVDTSGSVLSVGAARKDGSQETVAACLVKVIGGLHFSSPGSWPAKFSLTR